MFRIRTIFTFFFMLSCILTLGSAFSFTSSTQSVRAHEYEAVSLSCEVDSHFEYCDWTHNGKLCKFEWKYDSGNVERTSCNIFGGGGTYFRPLFTGDYGKHECKITFKASSHTQGKWNCHLESYVTGNWWSGYKVDKDLFVHVIEPTTLAPTTTTTSTTTTIPTTTTTRYSTSTTAATITTRYITTTTTTMTIDSITTTITTTTTSSVSGTRTTTPTTFPSLLSTTEVTTVSTATPVNRAINTPTAPTTVRPATETRSTVATAIDMAKTTGTTTVSPDSGFDLDSKSPLYSHKTTESNSLVIVLPTEAPYENGTNLEDINSRRKQTSISIEKGEEGSVLAKLKNLGSKSLIAMAIAFVVLSFLVITLFVVCLCKKPKSHINKYKFRSIPEEHSLEMADNQMEDREVNPTFFTGNMRLSLLHDFDVVEEDRSTNPIVRPALNQQCSSFSNEDSTKNQC